MDTTPGGPADTSARHRRRAFGRTLWVIQRRRALPIGVRLRGAQFSYICVAAQVE